MWRKGVAVALVATSGVAQAGETPLIEPAPAWVKPVDAAPMPKPQTEAAVTLLLTDQQVRFERGSMVSYQRSLVRIDTAQGLAAGNISLPWRPDVGDLRVHRLALHRGTETIDVLAGGQTFTVARREPNMEAAALDGVLTANLQVEGLQVGDVLELIFSISVRDPVLAGHVEQIVSAEAPLPTTRVHVRASWPRSLPVRIKTNGPLAAPKPIAAGGDQAIELTLDGVQPYQGPKWAPARYQIGRVLELSDFAAWSELGALMAPLYDKAAVLPANGPLADEVAKIKAASSDPVVRTTAALALVQDRIRYVALAMGSGGLVPADAATTWSRRYGDCKAKTALLLAVLRALDIPAEPVAASIGGGDGIDERLPAVGAFNHVLVRATVAGKAYWLDGTRTGDTSLERLAIPNFGWGLPLVAKGAALVRMVPAPLTVPTSDIAVTIDASAGMNAPAPFTVTTVLRGDEAIGTNAAIGALAGDARDRALREYWKRKYDFVTIETTKTAFDAKAGELRMTMAGKAKLDVSSGQYETDGLGLGYKADFARDPGPDRDAPFAVAYPRYERATETITLPPGFPETQALDKVAIDRTVAGVAYRRTAAIKGRVFHGEATERAIAPEFPASEAPAAQAALRQMANDTLWVRVPASYRPTEADLAAMEQDAPSTAAAYVDRGNALLEHYRFVDAIKDFDAALAIDPKYAIALADRGVARAWLDQPDAAEKDFAAAEAIDPRSVVLWRGRGVVAERKRDFARAVELYGKALAINPSDSFALQHRAMSYRRLDQPDLALADLATLLANDPKQPELRLIRANILRGQGKTDLALKELRAAIEATPDETFPYVAAANFHLAMGDRDEAMRLFDRALAVKREAYVYINRALAHPSTDLAGRRADYDAALAIEPTSVEALAGKASIMGKSGDWKGAVTLYDTVVAREPKNASILSQRGVAKSMAGDAAGADKDFAAARVLAGDSAMGLNSLCWNKATQGVALASALADCDAALARDPKSAAIIDSKGFVLLRLGRFDESIAAYDRALAAEPQQAASLFGRSIAYARKGDQARADADLKAARTLVATIDDQFTDFGVTR